MRDDKKIKLMFDLITQKLSEEILIHLEGLHIMHNLLHGTVDRLGDLIVETNETGSLESEKAFWESVKFMRTILDYQRKAGNELDGLLGSKIAGGIDEMRLQEKEKQVLDELMESGKFVVTPKNKTVH